jgi:hypothetical protein
MEERKMIRKMLALAAFALLCLSSVVLAGQNSNSSTTMEPKHEMKMGSMHGRRHRRHRRMMHRRHRHMKMKMSNQNSNM